MPLPSPLVPADCDLRDFPYMPVDIARLLNSEFNALATDSGWRAGMTLWLTSFHQVPASSLPGETIALVRLAELGRDTKEWAKIKNVALRSWIMCSDDRLYHPVVAEKALEAWIGKLGQRKSSAAGVNGRWSKGTTADEIDRQISVARQMLAVLNPQSRTLRRKRQKPGAGDTNGNADGTTNDTADGIADASKFGSEALPPSCQVKRVGELDSKAPSQAGGITGLSGEVEAGSTVAGRAPPEGRFAPGWENDASVLDGRLPS